jgi:hypothetical protein
LDAGAKSYLVSIVNLLAKNVLQSDGADATDVGNGLTIFSAKAKETGGR